MSALPPDQTANPSDEELLRRHSLHGEETALEELVRRYAPMVYAAARRQTGNADLAEDVTQCVFICLARKARSIRTGAVLPAWLLRTTHFTAANAMKIQARRRHYEKVAGMAQLHSQTGSDEEGQWESIRPLLDEAISQLPWADQTAVALRYFRGLSFGEVAGAIGTSELAARRRVSRAIGRLRRLLQAAGAPTHACEEATLTALLSSRAVESLSSHFLVHTIAAAQSAGKTAAGSIFYGALTMTATTKIAAGAAVLVLMVAGGYRVVRMALPPAETRLVSTPPVATVDSPSPLNADWQAKFKAVYALNTNEVAKLISPPFIAERPAFAREAWPQWKAQNPPGLEQLLIRQEPDGTLAAWGDGNIWDARLLACDSTNLWLWQIEGDQNLLHTIVPGDWVIRQDATPEQILPAIADVLSKQTGQNLVFTMTHQPRDMAIASGHARNDAEVKMRFFSSEDKGTSSGSGPIGDMIRRFSKDANLAMLDESTPVNSRYQFERANDVVLANQTPDDLLNSLAAQTGLTFRHEQRTVDIWTMTKEPPK